MDDHIDHLATLGQDLGGGQRPGLMTGAGTAQVHHHRKVSRNGQGQSGPGWSAWSPGLRPLRWRRERAGDF